MKNSILALAILLLVVPQIDAQETIVPLENKSSTDVYSEKYYFKDVNNKLNRFIGTWKYESTNESLEITFFKVEREDYGNYATDMLNCNFIYTRNGVTIFDTFPMTSEDDIFIFGSLFKTPDELSLFYSEPNSEDHWTARLNINIMPGGNIGDPVKLGWNIETLSTKEVNGQSVYPYEIPRSLELEKQ